MHPSAYKQMSRMVDAHVRPTFTNRRVLDVGSRRTDVDDLTHRALFPGWRYIGLDARPGDNVDVVTGGGWPELGRFEVVVCGQTLEHCRRPWEMVSSMTDVLFDGGILLLTAPFMWHLHDHPGDYYRFTGEGLAELCRFAGLSVLESGVRGIKNKKCRADAWCAARKDEIE